MIDGKVGRKNRIGCLVEGKKSGWEKLKHSPILSLQNRERMNEEKVLIYNYSFKYYI